MARVTYLQDTLTWVKQERAAGTDPNVTLQRLVTEMEIELSCLQPDIDANTIE